MRANACPTHADACPTYAQIAPKLDAEEEVEEEEEKVQKKKKKDEDDSDSDDLLNAPADYYAVSPATTVKNISSSLHTI
jgi:hypothetical protein